MHVYDGLADEDRRALTAQLRRRKFARREVIFHEGDPGEALHVVAIGHVGIRVTTPLGDVALVRVIGTGGFFGELALLSPGARSATAIALEPTQTMSLSREAFDELRSQRSEVNDFVLTALANEVRRLASAQSEALFVGADKRMYRRIVELATTWDIDGAADIPLTQEELGQLAGTTRSTANRILREAEGAGAIELRRGALRVLDVEWLTRRGR